MLLFFFYSTTFSKHDKKGEESDVLTKVFSVSGTVSLIVLIQCFDINNILSHIDYKYNI